ncbi:MAG: Mpo1-like protein [Pseudoalteromonas sp.]|uniref:DUF962 domain-containing protein n=1 Tax=unclassified Pseudoalteromonas TaxID=194690 RepID=UPI000C07648F|nr:MULTISPECIES: DUF962 domain-containing protein [unclassified Pseudoalteromonas]MDP2635784.1 DUF962 domain-containing protein [Pseudoalteromonas sp. 1_MG-2023]PHN91269.1 hypothetical protein CSC79_03150 [Pseudoalteromonas sp. 3D05]
MDNNNKSTSFTSFKEFYPYYLSEHTNKTCKRLHFIGSVLVLCLLGYSILTEQFYLLWFIPVIGYGFAWIGHLFFEKNRPATFKHPFYSLLGDWVMFKDILVGRIPW